MVQQLGVAHTVHLRGADILTKPAYRHRSDTATANSGKRWHSRVIPPGYVTVVDQLQQLAFRGHRVSQIQACEFVLVWAGRNFEGVQVPIIKRAVDHELKRADGMRDPFDGITLAVRPIVERIDAPLVSTPVMTGVTDAIHQGISHLHVGVLHVDPGAQDAFSVAELAPSHAFEEVQIFIDSPLAKGTWATGFGDRTTIGADFLFAQVIDIGLALLDQADCPRVELLEVVRCVEFVVSPVKPHPPQVSLDSANVLDILRFRVGVVESEIADTVILRSEPEIQRATLGVTDMRIPIWLRRKSYEHSFAPTAAQIVFHDCSDKIKPLCGGMDVVFRCRVQGHGITIARNCLKGLRRDYAPFYAARRQRIPRPSRHEAGPSCTEASTSCAAAAAVIVPAATASCRRTSTASTPGWAKSCARRMRSTLRTISVRAPSFRRVSKYPFTRACSTYASTVSHIVSIPSPVIAEHVCTRGRHPDSR